jgi:hypothetical protein
MAALATIQAPPLPLLSSSKMALSFTNPAFFWVPKPTTKPNISDF